MHSINIYLGRKKDLESSGKCNISTKDLKQGIVAILDWSSIYDSEKDFLLDHDVCHVSTDYFGGFGNQSASVILKGKTVFEKDDFESHCHPINEALKLFGVIREGDLDEFDTIGLGDFRTNSDFFEITVEDIPDMKYVRQKMDQEGFDYCFRSYSDFEEIKDEEFHRLRNEYKQIAQKLEEYINSKI